MVTGLGFGDMNLTICEGVTEHSLSHLARSVSAQ